jgi:hypothetical protein
MEPREPRLSKPEEATLKNMEGKLRSVRSAVRGVVKDYHTGLLLHGEGGTGKSYTVLNELKELGAKYTLHNSRITGRGLVDALERSPDDVHVIEDAETIIDDKRAWGVLRSALWSQSKKKPPERQVTWTAYNVGINFIFTGGIIVISNANLCESKPELRALKSRISVLGLDVTNDEIRALMKQICIDGFDYGPERMTPTECWEVATAIMERLDELQRNLDLRLLINGFRDFLQYKAGESNGVHWEDMLANRIKERVMPPVTRAGEKDEQARVAREIHAMKTTGAEKLAEWKRRTGLDKSAYYRAKVRPL